MVIFALMLHDVTCFYRCFTCFYSFLHGFTGFYMFLSDPTLPPPGFVCPQKQLLHRNLFPGTVPLFGHAVMYVSKLSILQNRFFLDLKFRCGIAGIAVTWFLTSFCRFQGWDGLHRAPAVSSVWILVKPIRRSDSDSDLSL